MSARAARQHRSSAAITTDRLRTEATPHLPAAGRSVTETRVSPNEKAGANPAVSRAAHSQRSDRGALRIRSTRTGTPAATALSGTSRVTIVEVPRTQLSPTVAPRRIATP